MDFPTLNPEAPFIETARRKSCHVVVETHSPELVKQVFSEIRDGKVSVDDVIVYKARRLDGHTEVKPITIEVLHGDVDVYENWESGISM